jgi:hypothetical protein
MEIIDRGVVGGGGGWGAPILYYFNTEEIRNWDEVTS